MAAQGRSDTLFVLTADNGMTFGAHRWPTKSVPYATPITLFFHWAGRDVGAPGVRTTTVSNIDMASTLCAIAGCVMGEPNARPVDGESFAPLIADPAATLARQFIYVESVARGPLRGGAALSDTESSDAGATGGAVYQPPAWDGVRTTAANPIGRLEYTVYATGECELYDLVADPWELVNRCDDAAFVSLRAQLESYRLQGQQ
jgi:arylsulfatase A-like enzyme